MCNPPVVDKARCNGSCVELESGVCEGIVVSYQPQPSTVAFFDLDKTILSTSASVALRHSLIDAGLLTRRAAAINLLLHLPYLIRGADEAALQRMSEQLGQTAKDWDSAVLEATVRDALETHIDPVVYVEALEQIALHRAAGRAIVIASASVEEMVRPIGELVGADYVIGTRAAMDEDGTFTGELERFNYSNEKAKACVELAEEHGWDLSESFAYSDCSTDLPLLESVGHPVAVNPDARLRAVALERHWQILSFTHKVRVRSTARRVVLPVAVTTLVSVMGAGALWWVLRGRKHA